MHNIRNPEPSSGIYWLGVIALELLFLVPGASTAQSIQWREKPAFATKPEADRFRAHTKPGYHTSLLVPDWRTKKVNSDLAVAAVAKLCPFARSQANSVTKELLLSGNRLDAHQVQLIWDMRDDATNDSFSVERSMNPDADFEAVTSIKSAVNSNQKVTYQTIDPNPNREYTYYRVKALDQTGRYTYSQVVGVKGDSPLLAVKAFPNPSVLKNVRFQVAGLETTEAVSVSLIDIQGRVLYQNEQAVPDAERQLTLPSSLDIPPGNYFLKIIAKNQQASTLFIVQP